MNNDRFTIREDEPEDEMGEVFCLTVLEGERLVVGLTIQKNGNAVLLTWPDGENCVSVELPTVER